MKCIARQKVSLLSCDVQALESESGRKRFYQVHEALGWNHAIQSKA
jgi:hypothetical protein